MYISLQNLSSTTIDDIVHQIKTSLSSIIGIGNLILPAALRIVFTEHSYLIYMHRIFSQVTKVPQMAMIHDKNGIEFFKICWMELLGGMMKGDSPLCRGSTHSGIGVLTDVISMGSRGLYIELLAKTMIVNLSLK
jgi:hypothetical protein